MTSSRRKPSRTVTCSVCGRRFKPGRSDARYCTAACRQRAHRARLAGDPTDREIEDARLAYWRLIERRALARGVDESDVNTEQAQFVDVDGRVFMDGHEVGSVTPDRPGWASWGLEAAGPPWSPPPTRAE